MEDTQILQQCLFAAPVFFWGDRYLPVLKMEHLEEVLDGEGLLSWCEELLLASPGALLSLMIGPCTGCSCLVRKRIFLRVAVELSYIAFFLFKPKEVFIGCRNLSLLYVHICVV